VLNINFGPLPHLDLEPLASSDRPLLTETLTKPWLTSGLEQRALVYHLATRQCALKDLSGIPAVLDHAGVMDVPQAKVAVLDGTAHAPGQPWKYDSQAISTLWGELACQLGKADVAACRTGVLQVAALPDAR
jgi:hypothetical protein